MRRAMTGFFAVAWLVAAGIAPAQAEPGLAFPGEATVLPAPGSDLKVSYVDTVTENGDHDYSLRLDYPDGRSEEILAFNRSVAVAWSPSGQALAVTNEIGPDVSDCYIVSPNDGVAAKISLTDVVTQGRFPAPAWALQHSSHGAVVCDGWAEPDKLRFVLQGYGGDSPNGFRYAFVYDLNRGVAKLVPAGARGKKSRPS